MVKKRTSRAKPILDEDDILLLKALYKSQHFYSLTLTQLKKKLNISHRGLLVHLKRLERYYLVVTLSICRGILNRYKTVYLRSPGINCLRIFEKC